MARAFITVTTPDFSRMRSEAKRLQASLRSAAIEATEIASKKAQRHVQAKMKAVGLGRLSNAVGHTSSKRKRRSAGNPFGVIYARGGDESRAGGALEAYSKGTTIRAKNGQWLAYPTKAVPKRVGRYKMTWGRYLKAGLSNSLGELVFRRIKPNLAILVLRNVSLSPKTGQAKRMGARAPRNRVPVKEVVAFILIKETRRAKRFDQNDIMRMYSTRVPDYIDRILKQTYR